MFPVRREGDRHSPRVGKRRRVQLWDTTTAMIAVHGDMKMRIRAMGTTEVDLARPRDRAAMATVAAARPRDRVAMATAVVAHLRDRAAMATAAAAHLRDRAAMATAAAAHLRDRAAIATAVAARPHDPAAMILPRILPPDHQRIAADAGLRLPASVAARATRCAGCVMA